MICGIPANLRFLREFPIFLVIFAPVTCRPGFIHGTSWRIDIAGRSRPLDCYSHLRRRSQPPPGFHDGERHQAYPGIGLSRTDPLDHHRQAVSGVRRRGDMVLAGAFRRGGIRFRRLLPFQFVSGHRRTLRTALHDSRSPRRRRGGMDNARRIHDMEVGAGHDGHTERHRHLNS